MNLTSEEWNKLMNGQRTRPHLALMYNTNDKPLVENETLVGNGTRHKTEAFVVQTKCI